MEGFEWFGFSWSWERWVVGAPTYDSLFAHKSGILQPKLALTWIEWWGKECGYFEIMWTSFMVIEQICECGGDSFGGVGDYVCKKSWNDLPKGVLGIIFARKAGMTFPKWWFPTSKSPFFSNTKRNRWCYCSYSFVWHSFWKIGRWKFIWSTKDTLVGWVIEGMKSYPII